MTVVSAASQLLVTEFGCVTQTFAVLVKNTFLRLGCFSNSVRRGNTLLLILWLSWSNSSRFDCILYSPLYSPITLWVAWRAGYLISSRLSQEVLKLSGVEGWATIAYGIIRYSVGGKMLLQFLYDDSSSFAV